MPFGRRTPLEALALPGAILAYKYSQFRQRRREAASRRVTERELSALHHKIDKLLNKLEETEPDPPTSQEDECVICINARATMQTSPCGHRVVCRRCFVKTIQSAVAQRLLPLRCVICRTRITRLTSSSGTCLRLQESASSYSMATSSRLGSWATGLGMSPSSYSVGAGGIAGARGGSRVAQSTSLYSMSSGASFVSGHSNGSAEASLLLSSSTIRSAASEPATHRLHHQNGGGGACCTDGCSGAYPRTGTNGAATHHHHIINHHHHLHHQNHNQSSSSSATDHQYQMQYVGRHRRSKSCRGGMEMHSRLPPIKEFRSPTKVPMQSPTNNPAIRFSSLTKSHEHPAILLDDEAETSLSICLAPSSTRSLGAILNQSAKSSTTTVAALPTTVSVAATAPVTPTSTPSDLPHATGAASASNPHSIRQHSANSTSNNPIGHRPRSRPIIISSNSSNSLTVPGRNSHHHHVRDAAVGNGANVVAYATTSFISRSPSGSSSSQRSISGSSNGRGARIAPITSQRSPINMAAGSGAGGAATYSKTCTKHLDSIGARPPITLSTGCIRKSTASGGNKATRNVSPANVGPATSSSSSSASSAMDGSHPTMHRGVLLLSRTSVDERADNRKNESVERKKRDDKDRQKAEKDARKEEKRVAKEEERLAKLMAKEEKKKGKREAKEMLLVQDTRKK